LPSTARSRAPKKRQLGEAIPRTEEWKEAVPWQRLSPRAQETKETIAVLISEGLKIDEVAERVELEPREVSRAMAELKEEARALVEGAAIPPLRGEERGALEESLRALGQLYPLLVDERGELLDGEHRKRLLEELGIEPEVKVVDTQGDEQLRHQIRLEANTVRRTLSAASRRVGIEAELIREPELSDRSIARTLGVAPPTVANVRHSLEERGQILRLERRVGQDGVPQKATKPPRERKSKPPSPPEGRSLLLELDPSDTTGGRLAFSAGRWRLEIPETEWRSLGEPISVRVEVSPE
jgi:ParB/Sulfiredoxin domain